MNMHLRTGRKVRQWWQKAELRRKKVSVATIPPSWDRYFKYNIIMMDERI